MDTHQKHHIEDSRLDLETITKVQFADIDHLRNQPVGSIDHIMHKIDYVEFFVNYLLPNRPCVLGAHVTQQWKSVQEWVTDTGQPNLDFLATRFGDATVPVANCNKMQYYAQTKTDMNFSEYVQYWKKYISNGHTSEDGCLYLKDWHFVHVFPDYHAYKTPIFFTSDWLNEFWDARLDRTDDDYRFVYMGPKGSWTPFHADVFRSFSWSANICGRKKWLLFPPGQEKHLQDYLGNLVYDVTSSELHDRKKYPHFEKACQPLEVVQEAGEVIFVPSGWHHQVFNLEDTVSINHNWLNGCNVDIMWDFLQQELSAVQKSISDCRDMDGWHSQCQLIMKASTGIDYSEFFQFLHIIASKRLNVLKNSLPNKHADPDNSKKDKIHPQNDDHTSLQEIMEQPSSTNSNTVSIHSKESEHLKRMSPTTNEQKEQRTGTYSLLQVTSGTEFQHSTSETALIQRIPNTFTCPEVTGVGVWHSVFDLEKIKKVMECLIGNKEFQELDDTSLCDNLRSLHSDICQMLENDYIK